MTLLFTCQIAKICRFERNSLLVYNASLTHKTACVAMMIRPIRRDKNLAYGQRIASRSNACIVCASAQGMLGSHTSYPMM